MSFSDFEINFLSQLKNKDDSCLKTIHQYEIVIQQNLGSNFDQIIMDKFIDNINDIIININSSLISNSYTLVEKALKEPAFNQVLASFRNSDILIKACKYGNKNTAKWLLNMGINPCKQDENDKTALMYAAEQGYEFVIKKYMNNIDCLNLQDKNGENVLFYSVRHPKFITSEVISNNKYAAELIKSGININQKNIHGETVLTYCCKNKIYKPINQYLLQNNSIDPNIVDENDYTAAMYLTEEGRYLELLNLNKVNCNYNYINKNGESALSILIKKYYSYNKEHNQVSFEKYVRVMSIFVNYQIDFNSPIDEDGNTPVMVMLMMNDVKSASYCIKLLKNLNLSVKNIYGDNITSLCCILNNKKILDLIKDKPTYDHEYENVQYDEYDGKYLTLCMKGKYSNYTCTKSMNKAKSVIYARTGEETLSLESLLITLTAVPFGIVY